MQQLEGNNETAVTAENEDDVSKGKNRPLAARRNLVKKTVAEEGGDDTPIKEGSAESTEDNSSSADTKIDSTSTKEAAAVAAAVAANIEITSQRTRDIEKEIAINNAKHDTSVTAKVDDKSKVVVKKVRKRDELMRIVAYMVIMVIVIMIIMIMRKVSTTIMIVRRRVGVLE